MLVQEDTRGQPVSSLSKVGSSLLSSSTIAGEVRLKNVAYTAHLQHSLVAEVLLAVILAVSSLSWTSSPPSLVEM